ncbi:conserved hypothetical protein [Gammaproteobacteria bacterium]
MQTFLPYPDINLSLAVLDTMRAGKQRIEARQILRTLSEKSLGWKHHPAVKMWAGYENALKSYYNVSVETWINRGYKNTMQIEIILGEIQFPPWFGREDFHLAHRSNLMRKAHERLKKTGKKDLVIWYTECFGLVPLDLPYQWQ